MSVAPKVLVASDGSERAVAAARGASVLLPRGAVYTVVTVVGDVPGAPDEEVEAHGAEILAPTVAALGGDVAEVVATGDPPTVISDVAVEVGADVIVVGAQGHSGLARVLLGSVADHLVRHAARPVLVIRPPAHQGSP